METRHILLAVFVILIVLCGIVFAVINRTKIGGTEYADSDFPFWKYSLPKPKKMFGNLKHDKLHVDDNILYRTYPSDYVRVDALSNHYTEGARIDCRLGTRPTPRETWLQIRDKYPMAKKSNRDRRDLVYTMSGGECNTFNLAFAKWIIEQTVGHGAKILDPSSGWGDRLIAAIATNASVYHGCDPNPRLQNGYAHIINDLVARENRKNYYVRRLPFEDLNLKGEKYQLVLTSPPYYDLEIYVQEDGAGYSEQSTTRWPDFDGWVANMYKPYLLKAYDAVEPGGWLVLYIEDIRSGNQHYPLRSLTEEILGGTNAEPAPRFGLAVKYGKKEPKIRWALAWRKPLH